MRIKNKAKHDCVLDCKIYVAHTSTEYILLVVLMKSADKIGFRVAFRASFPQLHEHGCAHWQ